MDQCENPGSQQQEARADMSMGPEQKKLMDRLFADPERELVNFQISAGKAPVDAETLCAEINSAMDQVERRRAAGDMGDGPVKSGRPRVNLRQLLSEMNQTPK